MSLAEADRCSITGVGLVSGYGIGADPCFTGLLGGERASVHSTVEAWPAGDHTLVVAGPTPAQVTAILPPQQLKPLNMETRMAQAASLLALEDAELDQVAFSGESCGVVVSAQQTGLQDYADLFWAGMRSEDAMVSPTRGPQAGFNAAAGYLGIRTGAQGPNVTILNGTVGGVDALVYAMDAIADGRATTMLVCGIGSISPVEVPLLADDEGRWEPRPFDVERQGVCYGNVAAAVVLEKSGQRRPGEAIVTAAHTSYSPDTDLEKAMHRSLARVLAEDQTVQVAACFASANGSLIGDVVEAGVLSAALDRNVPVCAVKGGVGECSAASVLVQAAIATLSLRHSLLPLTPGLEEATGLLRLRVPREPEPLSKGTLLVHVWDPAGAAGALAMRGAEEKQLP